MTAAALTAWAVLLVATRLRPLAMSRRLDIAPSPSGPQAVTHERRRWLQRRRKPGGPELVAAWCDDLARAVRSGSSLTTAIVATAPPDGLGEPIGRVSLALSRGSSLTQAITRADGVSTDLDLALVVIRACAQAGGSPAEPIDRAAAALRARGADLADRRTQSAQARMSATVMTVLPIAMACVLFVTSSSVRSTLTSPIGAASAAAGLALNLTGWWWMRRVIDGRRTRSRRMPAVWTARRSKPDARALPDVIDLIILGVRAGLSPTVALGLAAEFAPPSLLPAFDEMAHRLRRGQRLADAVRALPELLGPAAAGLADGLAGADRYGSPIEPVLDRLAADVRVERRRQAERDARTLPVRLSFPLVSCTLPSFVMLAIAPAVLGAVSTLRGPAA